MTRRGAWEPLLAVLSLLILGGAVTWYVLAELLPPKAPIPGYTGQPFHALAANMPKIANFEAFYTNADNPFVPWQERAKQAAKELQPKTVVLRPRQPAKIDPIPTPVVKYPPKAAGGGDAPLVYGFQVRKDQPSAAIVQIPGESKPRTMLPGDKVGRWTFVSIEAGNIANFTDQTGRTYAVVIGGKK